MDFETGSNPPTKNQNGHIKHELPETICLPSNITVTKELVSDLIRNHIEKNVPRYKQLQKYYEGWAPILNRKKDSHKANNTIVSGYPSYIVDVMLGMFVGKPIIHSVGEDLQTQMDNLQEIFDLNDEQDENTEIAKMCAIKGRAYEIIYQDEEANTRFNELPPDNVVFVYDEKKKPEPLFAIYFHKILDPEDIFSGEEKIRATVYGKNKVVTYEGTTNELTLIEEESNKFSGVQVVEFLNNDEGIGDFERVLSQIDSYNLSLSDTTNDFEEFTNALLKIYGMLNTDAADVKQMMEDGFLLFDFANEGNQDADWLIKDINDTALENHNNRLDNDIHKFSKVPNMSDESFAGNVSGESMKYKLLAMDQVIAAKQRKFKTGLQGRLELILDILEIRGKGFDYRDVEISFNDNKPVNEKEAVEMAVQYSTLGSKTTALSRVPFVDNVNDELQRIEEENDGYTTMAEAMELLESKQEDDADEEII